MKKLLASILSICVCTISIYAQTVNKIPLNELKSEFVTVTHKESSSLFLGRVVIEFGNGAYVSNLKRKREDEADFRDANGNPLEIDSAIYAVNLFVENGYEMIDFRSTAYSDVGLVTTYLLAKKAVSGK